MKIAYASILPANDVNSWSGLNLHIADCLRAQGAEVHLLPPLHDAKLATFSKIKALTRRIITGKRHLWTRDARLLRAYGRRLGEALAKVDCDLVFSPGTEPLAHLPASETRPVAFWTDAPFAAMSGYYAWYQNLADRSLADGLSCDALALGRSSLAIYSSDWAADAARQAHGLSPEKVAVVPFGANLEPNLQTDQLATCIAERLQPPWRFLFVGVEWERKGGPKAVETVAELNRRGYPSELVVVGCQPPASSLPLPGFVHLEGFLSKRTEAGRQRLAELYRTSLFFLMPALAEAYGIVFCEANAHGVPCLSTATGGIPTIIHHGENGFLFAPDAVASEIAEKILQFIRPLAYTRLSEVSLGSYQERLNWRSSGTRLMQLLEETLHPSPTHLSLPPASIPPEPVALTLPVT